MNIGLFVSGDHQHGKIYQYTLSILRILTELNRIDCFYVFISDQNSIKIESVLPSHISIIPIPQRIIDCPGERKQNLTEDGMDLQNPGINKDAAAFFKKYSIDLMIYPKPQLLAFEAGVPYIMAVHELHHRISPQFPEVSAGSQLNDREYRLRNGARYANAILVDSKVSKENILDAYGKLIPRDNVHILPFLPCYSQDKFDLTTGATHKLRELYKLPDHFLIYPAHFLYHKNHARLIHSLQILKSRYQIPIHLVLVGENKGEHKEEERERVFENMLKLAAKLNVTDFVHYFDCMTFEHLAVLYQEAKALVIPTYFGSTNIPIAAAWSFGCPVVTSDIHGVREQVGDAALLANPESADDIADKIKAVLTDNNLKENLIHKGYQRLAAYTPETFETNFNKMLSDVKASMQIMSEVHELKSTYDRLSPVKDSMDELEAEATNKNNTVVNDTAAEFGAGAGDNRHMPLTLSEAEPLRPVPHHVAKTELAQDKANESNLADAIAVMEEELEEKGNAGLMHNNLGAMYYQQGQKVKAFIHYQKAVLFEPNNPTYLKTLADYLCTEQRNIKEALSLYIKVLESAPDDIETLLVTGHICVALNKYEDAIEFYKRIMKIDPANSSASENLNKLVGGRRSEGLELRRAI
jgi:glycosyltransferase involved in cell wall biosynthesis